MILLCLCSLLIFVYLTISVQQTYFQIENKTGDEGSAKESCLIPDKTLSINHTAGWRRVNDFLFSTCNARNRHSKQRGAFELQNDSLHGVMWGYDAYREGETQPRQETGDDRCNSSDDGCRWKLKRKMLNIWDCWTKNPSMEHESGFKSITLPIQ